MNGTPQAQTELRRFGIITALIVSVLFGTLSPWILDRPFPVWPWVLGGFLLSAGLLMPHALGPVHRGWMAIGHLLGWINTRLLLGLVFYTLLLPTGFVMRVFGHDPMRRTLDADASTYRVHGSNESIARFERPF